MFILHEGLLGVLQEKLELIDYDDLKDDEETLNFESDNGWVGITDKYWLAALIPDQNKSCLLYTSPSPRDRTRSRMPSSA